MIVRRVLRRAKRAIPRSNRAFPTLSSPTKRLFISADVTVAEGDEAANRLLEKNDARYFSTSEGIVSVDRARWEEAQHYEERTWSVLNRDAADDRNVQHFQRFRGFKAIAGRRFDNVIELGCGPFTNLRLLADVVGLGSVDLLDPLAESYLEHPHCTYRDGALVGHPVRLHPVAIEDFEPDRAYDLVLMLNVIEHCFDAGTVFAKVLTMLEDDGVFVFHDKLYPAKAIDPSRLYDAGHPLRVRSEVIKSFLRENFKPLFRRTINDREVGLPMTYFIGTKR